MRKFINRIQTQAGKIRFFFSEGIWRLNPADLPSKWKARLVKELRVIQYAARQFNAKGTGFQSIALCYFCLMATVPFIAVSFALTGGLGIEDRLMEFVYSNFGESEQLVSVVQNAAARVMVAARSGIFGLISALLFAWPIVWMMNRVEKVFNNVWGINHARKFYTQFLIAVGIILLSPFVVTIFFTGSIVYSHVLDLLVPEMDFTENLKSFLGWIVFCASSVLIFSVMYKFIPSAKVRYRYAFRAAVISGAAFTLLQYLYLETQVLVTRINAMYGTVAALPLFILWLRYGWLIILYGAQFSYSFQMNGENKIIESR